MGRPRKLSRREYGEFLMASQINYTHTYHAQHREGSAHDAIRRYLLGDRVTARQVWETATATLVSSTDGYLVFDDSVLFKNHARKMGLVRRQYSGNEGRVIRGIGVVSCVYVNPHTQQFWLIDYRLFAPEQDGKSKHDHVHDMFIRALEREQAGELSFRGVLMDRWYAVSTLLTTLARAHKTFVCPVKGNRRVHVLAPNEDPSSVGPYASSHLRVDTLTWDETHGQHSVEVHLRESPRGFKVKVFRLASSTGDTEWIVTNDDRLQTTQDVRMTHALRWCIEQFHRELKGVTGVEGCQCRASRAQRNHIGLALLVWQRLKRLALQAGTSVYALKFGLLSDFMSAQLRSPSLSFA